MADPNPKPNDTQAQKSRRQLLADKILVASQRSLTIQMILVVSAFASLVSSLFPILKSINVSDNVAYLITAIATVIVVVLLLAFFFIHGWKVYLFRVTIVLWLIISLVLCVLLYWTYFIKVDPWVAWNDKVSSRVAACENIYREADPRDPKECKDQRQAPSPAYLAKASCISKAIEEKYPHPGEDGVLKINSLANDVRAGTYLLNDELVKDVLCRRLGIDKKFIGTGLAIPSGDARIYADARLPEYLVPNLSEEPNEILTWKLPPALESALASETVGCLIIGCNRKTPTSPSNINLKVDEEKDKYNRMIEYIKSPENRYREDKIVLIRFNRFSPNDYKGKLGLDSRKWVFMLRLRDVWDTSLRDALTFSGHQTESPDSSKAVFVWVYLSDSSDNSRIQATWKNILNDAGKLLD